jgi:RNA polymerase sigma-70 factor (TIGR02943 family)
MKEGQGTPAAAPPDPARWVDEHGDYLYRFALARAGRPEAAEDLVQETLLAAMQAASRFAGRASERTWLTGILKNKLIDRLRQGRRMQTTSDLGQADAWLDGLYDRTGHWKAAPGRWGADPAELLQRREFWDAFERCRAGLPDRLREVLSLRLLDDVPAVEVCQTLGISATNLWTLLHRARLRLWHCLDGKGLGLHPSGG